MIKYICDKCKVEIKPQELSSNYNYVETTLMVAGGQSQPQRTEVNQLFCEKCTSIIKEAINK